MTTERWNDDQLDRLASETSNNTANIKDLVKATETLRQRAEAQQHERHSLYQEMRNLMQEVRLLVEELRQRREGGN